MFKNSLYLKNILFYICSIKRHKTKLTIKRNADFSSSTYSHSLFVDMEALEIFENKKGTKVVLASHLYRALALSHPSFSSQIRQWLKGYYEFEEGRIRCPEVLRDFAHRPSEGGFSEDYYLTLHFAKLITLHTKSKFKLRYAKILDAVAQGGQMSLFVGAA